MNTLQVCVNGKPIKQYPHQGKVFIEARDGTEYTLKLHNVFFRRRLVVVTVDGINVVSGKPQGSEIGRGYIIPSNSSIEIKGFRQDLGSVGMFKFCNKNKSYGNSKGAEGNNGVIGIRMYNEKQRVTYSWTSTSSDNSGLYKVPINTGSGFSPDILCYRSDGLSTKGECFSKMSDFAPNFELGTTWGQKVNDSVTLIDFDNESWVAEESTLYYDTRKNLESIGVSLKEEKHVNTFPQAFAGFAKPPQNWRG